jgi:predicted GNAT family N-acyltransferase
MATSSQSIDPGSGNVLAADYLQERPESSPTSELDGNHRTYKSGVANTAEEKHQAYRLRYAVYIAEQGKSYPEADVFDQALSDDLDSSAAVLTVMRGSECCGTVRTNWFSCPLVASIYGAANRLELFQEIPADQLAICSRLAVAPQHRGGNITRLLFSALYAVGLRCHTVLCFQNCRPPLVPFFVRYGFQQYLPTISDPVVGTLHPMVLALDDLEYFEQVDSPLLSLAIHHGVRHCTRPWFRSILQRHDSCDRVG